MELALLGGGCFWCTEHVFRQLKGVRTVRSGYAGGSVPDPTYEQICTGQTGHAEVIEVGYDSERISYRDLLEVFFATHDPTTLNRQGADTGTQYRSVVFYMNQEQAEIASTLIEELNAAGIFEGPIVTAVTRAPEFYAAEDYHQDFYNKNPQQGYCVASITPKLGKLREKFNSLLGE